MTPPLTPSHAGAQPILTQTIQGCLLIAMPVTLTALGGPVLIWSNGGYTVRILLSTVLIPSTVCAAGAMENAARSICLAAKDIFAQQQSINNLQNNERLMREIRRCKGLSRAALFPPSAWSVVAKLPISDYYIYALPIESIKETAIQTANVSIILAKRVDRLMTITGFYTCMRVTCRYTVKPAWICIKKTTVAAYDILEWGLGKASDIVTWGLSRSTESY